MLMKNQFQSLTEKGRWLLATLTLIFTLGIGQMWGVTATPTPAGTYAIGNNKAGGQYRFLPMLSGSVYNYRMNNSSYGDAGMKLKGNDNAVIVYLGSSMDLTVTCTLNKDNKGEDAAFTVYTIAKTSFDEIISKENQYSSDGSSRTVQISTTGTQASFTVEIPSNVGKGTFTGSPTSSLPAGYYYIVGSTNADGSGNVYFTNIILAAGSGGGGGGQEASAAPTINTHPSTAYAQYLKDATGATALSVEAEGNGTLSYQWYKNTTESNAGGTALENCTTATYTPSTAAEGKLYYYCAVTNTESGKSATTVKSNVSGMVRVIPAPTHLVENVMATSGNWDSYIVSTNAHISNLKTITASDGKTLIKSGKESASNSRTPGITSKNSSALDEDDYIYLQFTIEDGYELTVSGASVQVFSISNTGKYVARISDNASTPNVIATNETSVAQSADKDLFNGYSFASSPTLRGTVTLKLFAYGWGDGYRMKSPMYIDGTITAIPTPVAPSISAPTADQAAVYDLNDVITPLAITASGYPTPTYQWYKNTSASTEGATALENCTTATYTPANNVASNLYYYCVATNSQGSATSHFFHVTVNAPTVPTIYTETTGITLASDRIAQDEKSFTFSGLNLEHNVTISLESDVAGMSVSPAVVIPIEKTITDQEVTIRYKSLEDVAEANVNLVVAYSETVKLIVPLTYSSTEGYETVTSISAATTWNWTNANSAEKGTLDANSIIVLANMDGWVNTFNARAISGRLQYYYYGNNCAQGHNLKFNTTVPGKVSVKFSNTGKKDVARAPRITDAEGTYAATEGSYNTKDADKLTYSHNVAAGDVFIEGFVMSDPIVLNMLRFYEVKFLPTHTLSFAGGGTIEPMTVAETETAILPDVDPSDVPTGKMFNGWYSGNVKAGDAGDEYTMGTADVELTANFITSCTTPTIAWNVQPKNSRSITGTQAVSVTLTEYTGAITWISSDPSVATVSGTDANATITYVGEGTTTITAKFVIPAEQALCEGTYQVTKEITLMNCPEPDALDYEIARFQVPACGIDHDHALTNSDVARDNCTVTVSNGVGGSSSNWWQISTPDGLWYAKFQSSGEVVLKVDGDFQEGDVVHVYMRAVNGNGLKFKTSQHEIKTTQNDNTEVDLEYEVLAADIEEDGSLDFVRISSNTYVNRVIVTRPPCHATHVAWATEPAAKVRVGDADGTATITSNYLTGVTYSSSNPSVASIVSGNGTNTVTIHYVAEGTTTITATVTGADPYCTDPISVSKEIRVIGEAPAYGTLYKFQVKTLDNGVYIFDTYPASMEMTTENYLAELQGGELTASVTGGAQRLYIDNSGYEGKTAFVFTGGSGGLLTMDMDYPLAAGDVVKYQVMSGTSDKLKLSDADNADHNTTLTGSGDATVQTFEIPASWAGATILKIERTNNSPRIPYIEVYRRQAVTGVSLADATVAVDAVITPVMTILPSAEAYVSSQEWSILDDPNEEVASINATTGAVTGIAAGAVTVQVKLNNNNALVATCQVEVISEYSQVSIDNNTVWNFANALIDKTKNAALESTEELLLANVTNIVNDPVSFNSQALVVQGIRVDKSGYTQAATVKFITDAPGFVNVEFSNTGNAPRPDRYLLVNGERTTYKSGDQTHVNAKGIYVPAGEVVISSEIYQNEEYTASTLNIFKVEFIKGQNMRTLTPGRMGTFTTAYDVKMFHGADFFVPNQTYSLGIEFISVDELKAGYPYFMVANDNALLVVNEGDAATVAEEDHSADGTRGMVGYLGTDPVRVDVPDGEDYAVVKNNHLYTAYNNTMTAGYAYFDMTIIRDLVPMNANNSNGAPRRRMTVSYDAPAVVTNIDNIETNDTPMKVMIDGQLFIIRGEKMFDATGRLVK